MGIYNIKIIIIYNYQVNNCVFYLVIENRDKTLSFDFDACLIHMIHSPFLYLKSVARVHY